MNCTSFSLLDPATSSESNIDKMANIDSSSTAHLTLNAAGISAGGAGAKAGAPRRSASSNNSCRSSNSDDLDISPNVTVLTMGSSSITNSQSLSESNGGGAPAPPAANRKGNSIQRAAGHGYKHPKSSSNSDDNCSTSVLVAGGAAAAAGAATGTGSGSGQPANQYHHLNHHPHATRSSSTTSTLTATATATANVLNHRSFVSRPRTFITSGFSSVSNRFHLGKTHPSNVWTRATPFEKVLMGAIVVLFATSVLLLLSLASVLVQQRSQLELLINQTKVIMANDLSHEHAPNKYCLTPDCVKVAASIMNAIDTTVDPCEDFYMYACGEWIKSNPLPDGKSNWGTFGKLWQDNQSIMRAVLENAEFKPGSAEEKAKIYYESCLDKNNTLEQRGAKPMQELIESAGGWNVSGAFDVKTWDIQNTLQIYHNQYNRGGLFSWAVGSDERNSTSNIIQLDQGGLGLPSRDYYLNKTDKNVLNAYLLYMTRVAELMGGHDAEEQMKDVLEFERRLAVITIPQDQRRDDERMYHKFTLRELTARSKFLNWTRYFDEAFDYHSKTTISFSSEIRPRQNISDINERLKYSIAGNGNGQPADNNKTTANDVALSSNSIELASGGATESLMQKARQPSSVIGRHAITDDEHVVIYSPEYFANLSNLIEEYSASERGKVAIANYMAWSVIQSLIATLPKEFRDASKILRKALIGSEGIESNWRYCVADTNQVMGFALGSLFVRQVFQGKSKERAEEMIYSIRNAFKDNLPNLNWMDEKTRMLAKEKADYINQMIGFPEFILNPEKLNGKYEGLELDEQNYFENNIKVNVLSLRENMEKINKPANKTEWEMTPPMVNAYYTPTKNQIAGILQTPFYDLSYPNSLNYGAMGVVMGHELIHAFDDQGREYDKDGNLYQWWDNETLRNFEERVRCFVDQYSSYKIDDNNLNGKQTLGENIADNGGLKAAFRAYENWYDTHTETQLPGISMTSKQLFFVAFAQVWCSISTPEALKLQVLNDPHAPAQYRVIGTLSNSHEFSREFNCPLGSKMNPEKKCVVW